METPERILIVYLKTGGGHITLAQIIAQKILARGDGAEAVLRNGFAPGQFFCRSLFETGYHLTSIAARGAYSLYYDINLIPWVLRITTALVNLRTRYHLRRIVRREGITRIVCLHFALGPGCRFAADRAGRKVPVFVVVTDPFTAHPSWFLAPDAHYIVFSRELKTHMREKFGIEDARIFPFVLKDEYTRPQETESAGGKKGVFSVLVTGGGEGLPGIIPLVGRILREERRRLSGTDAGEGPGLALTVVCGRDRLSYGVLSRLAKKTPSLLTVHGYVRDMPDLIQKSDCVVTKAGASLTMEVLALRKPLIISTYIHGQELGNVRYVTRNGAGWFIQKPADIYRKLLRLAQDPSCAARAAENARKLGVSGGAEAVAAYIMGEAPV